MSPQQCYPLQQQQYRPQPSNFIANLYESITPLISDPQLFFRHKTVKTVELATMGNFVVDIPVPEKVLALNGCSPGTAESARRAWGSNDTVVSINDRDQRDMHGTTPVVDDDSSDVWTQIASALFGLSPNNAVPENQEAVKESSRSVRNLVTSSVVDDSREFTYLRYTAATCDPNDFASKGYRLRAQDLDRKTEIFIVITMYNEDELLFTKTWKAVVRNIAYLCSKRRSSVWGPDGWKKIVVCVVADGREKIHKRTLTVLGIMGAYQDGIIKTSVNGTPTTAHIFEYTTQILVEPNSHQTVRGSKSDCLLEKNLPPVQIIFCLKERNAKKINSHRWFFNAFGRLLKPEVCILLDVGTKPTDRSIYHLWKAFNKNPNVGGACGEIYVELGCGWSKLWNPLVAAQNFEYKLSIAAYRISNILDKPFESCFGFISVLPGAFSAYRYKALQNDEKGIGPLEKYFMGETLHDGGDISKANMYLAEDRILCFELVSKRGQAWVLKYVRKAKAETDVPDSVAEFISQRRRWLNGSFFAGVHALVNCHQILIRSNHPLGKKMMFMVQGLYNLVNLIFNWFALGNMYLVFVFLGNSVVSNTAIASNPQLDPFHGYGGPIFIAFKQLYLYAIILVFLSSLGNRPQASKTLYTACFLLFAVIMAGLLYMTGYSMYYSFPRTADQWNSEFSSAVQAPILINMILSLACTYGVYFLASFLYCDPFHMFTSLIQYLLLMPSFINILMVYAFCNIHDVSWGTKGSTSKTIDPSPVQINKNAATGKTVCTTDLPTNQSDIDALYDVLLADLSTKPTPKRFSWFRRSAAPAFDREDFFKLFRTRVVLFWLSSNAVLIMVMTTEEIAQYLNVYPNSSDNPYVVVILYSVAVLSVLRFIGSCMYLVLP
ncbi:Chitin synthase, class 2 [Podochytrium sp. JEL0797]|nr:Chitin synthase, class 2 [Podochytrium sp. JEL0797]